LRLLVARLTHNHVKQYPACGIFADHMISLARERPLAMIAKYFLSPFDLRQQGICHDIKY
jgi:hypothetical protein